MSFVAGVKKIFEGLEDLLEATFQAADNLIPNIKYYLKQKNRMKFSGIHKIYIPADEFYAALVVTILYDGELDTFDIKSVCFDGETVDIFDELIDDDFARIMPYVSNWLSATIGEKNKYYM